MCLENYLPAATMGYLEPMLSELFYLRDAPQDESQEEKLFELCQQRVKQDLAFILFDITKPTIQRVVKRERVTPADLLGNLGGTLGLFTGMSLLSIAEVIFWIYRFLARNLMRRCRQDRKL